MGRHAQRKRGFEVTAPGLVLAGEQRTVVGIKSTENMQKAGTGSPPDQRPDEKTLGGGV